jgi:hypothetical protein
LKLKVTARAELENENVMTLVSVSRDQDKARWLAGRSCRPQHRFTNVLACHETLVSHLKVR